MSPRSILKHSSSSYTNPSAAPPMSTALPYHPPPPQVHFPPTPALTQTHYTHSGKSYDRAPIVVMPNECALPERGCRIYSSGRGSHSGEGRPVGGGKHPHPRVAEASSDGRIPSYYGPVPGPHQASSSMASRGPPPLVPDLSSESEESDGVVSPPPEYHSSSHGQQSHHGYGVHIVSASQEQLNKALSFLPHPAPDPKPQREKERRRRSEPRFKSEDASRSFASSSLDGCLGGF